MRARRVLGVATGCLALLAGGSAATSASTTARAKTHLRGIEAVLPANAATGENQDVHIESVSCPAAGNCSAVGSYQAGAGGEEGLLLTEKAGKWKPGVEVALPRTTGVGEGQVWLTSVSCASAGNCTAVGYYSDVFADHSGDERGLLLTEKAGKWKRGVAAVLPANASSRAFVVLDSVSCASAGNCSAVGSYATTSGVDEGLLLTEKAGRWEIGEEAQLPSNGDGAGLSSVSCATAGSCSAVGEYGGGGLLLTKQGGKWRIGAESVMPKNALADKPVSLTSVSCASPGNCSAVGTYNNAVGSRDLTPNDAVLLTEKAGKWRAGVRAVLPANALSQNSPDHQPELNSVSCPSAGNCVAVGAYEPVQGIEGLLVAEKAGKWQRGLEAARPRHAAGPIVELSSVSCASPGDCTAVDSDRGLLVTETEGRWAVGAVAALPSNSRSSGALIAVSCASPGNCSAVGSYGPASGVAGLLLDSSAEPCVVPRLKGMILSAAERSIESHGCSVGGIERVTSQLIERDHVISQTPKPGKRLDSGAKVGLVVSRGR